MVFSAELSSIIMPPHTIGRGALFIFFWLSVCKSVIVGEHFSQTACRNFTKFTALVHLGTKTNWLPVDFLAQKVKSQDLVEAYTHWCRDL